MDSPLMTLFNLLGSCRKSTIEYETSKGVEGTAGVALTVGLSRQNIKLKDTATGISEWLYFGGAGAGLGLGSTIGGSFSTEDFMSFGSKIIKGPRCWGQLEFSD